MTVGPENSSNPERNSDTHPALDGGRISAEEAFRSPPFSDPLEQYPIQKEYEKGTLGISDEGTALVTLGAPKARVVTFSEAQLLTLRDVLIDIEEGIESGEIERVIYRTEPKDCFIFGADLNEFLTKSDDELRFAIEAGHTLFQQNADLGVPTLALVEGACPGGGAELAVSCTKILGVKAASLEPFERDSTSFSFPEVKIGLFPGWGGTARSPERCGLAAFELVLTGKSLSVDEAYRIRFIDGVTTADKALDAAEELLREPKGSPMFHRMKRTGKGLKADLMKYLQECSLRVGYSSDTFNFLTKAFSGKDILEQVVAQSKKGLQDFDPTERLANPRVALDVLVTAVTEGTEAGLAAEREKVIPFILSPKTKNAIRFHFAETAVKDAAKGVEVDLRDKNIAVVGAGQMGAGIATAFNMKGAHITLSDAKKEALDKASEHAASAVKKAVSRGKLTSEEKRICLANFSTELNCERFGGTDLVIEAVSENMDLKLKLLPQIEESLLPGAILASNTSSKSITELAKSLRRPSKFCGIHFFNPAEKMKLVEVVQGEKTSNETLSKAKAFAKALGKLPVVVKDVPGFLVNRVLTRYLGESQYLLQDGYFPADIDLAGKHAGYFMGPLDSLDLVGLDIAGEVLQTLHDAYGERMLCPTFGKELLDNGHLGQKSGRGFHEYQPSGKGKSQKSRGRNRRVVTSSPKQLVARFGGDLTNLKPYPDLDYIASRLTLPLVDEAVRCLDEGVAGFGKFGAQQINVAMLYGTGALALHAGPISWAELQGAQGVVDQMNRLADREQSERFLPCESLVERAKAKKSFYEEL